MAVFCGSWCFMEESQYMPIIWMEKLNCRVLVWWAFFWREEAWLGIRHFLTASPGPMLPDHVCYLNSSRVFSSFPAFGEIVAELPLIQHGNGLLPCILRFSRLFHCTDSLNTPFCHSTLPLHSAFDTECYGLSSIKMSEGCYTGKK